MPLPSIHKAQGDISALPPSLFLFFNCMLFGVWPILSKVGLLRAGPAYLLSTVDEFDQKPAKECKLKKK